MFVKVCGASSSLSLRIQVQQMIRGPISVQHVEFISFHFILVVFCIYWKQLAVSFEFNSQLKCIY